MSLLNSHVPPGKNWDTILSLGKPENILGKRELSLALLYLICHTHAFPLLPQDSDFTSSLLRDCKYNVNPLYSLIPNFLGRMQRVERSQHTLIRPSTLALYSSHLLWTLQLAPKHPSSLFYWNWLLSRLPKIHPELNTKMTSFPSSYWPLNSTVGHSSFLAQCLFWLLCPHSPCSPALPGNSPSLAHWLLL